MKSTLFEARPSRNYRLTFTIIGSLLFHGALVGGAAFFKRLPEPDPAPKVTEWTPIALPPTNEPLTPPEASPSTPEPEPVPVPVVSVPDIADEPPPLTDPEIFDPTPATPPPIAVRQPITPVRPHGTPTQNARTNVAGPTTGRPGASGGTAAGLRWKVSSKPSYPSALRLARIQGAGMVKITTDAAGRVVSAVIVQSSGNSLLDEHTCQFARSAWSGPANTALNVPFTYKLQ